MLRENVLLSSVAICEMALDLFTVPVERETRWWWQLLLNLRPNLQGTHQSGLNASDLEFMFRKREKG